MSVFGKLTVSGVDIGEFSIYSYDKKSADYKVIKSAACAEKLSSLLGLPIAEEMGDGHYIVLRASELDPNGYSVRIEKGNIYISGSFVSFDKAYEVFLSDVLGYKEGDEDKILALTEKNSVSGSMGFTVPYTKKELYDLFLEASEDEKAVISGNHAYQVGTEKGRIGSTAQKIFEESGCYPAIIEIDVGRNSVYFEHYSKGETICEYDLSAYISECAEHVSKGGIISICIHMSNPLRNAPDKVWYRGKLGSNDVAVEMLTEGTELNAALRKTLESTFMVIKALSDNGIPFMFRPLHEMNGGWFWWCVNQGGEKKLTEETMHNFWKFFHKVITEEMGVSGALWVYSPNYNPGWCADVLYAYPGDEYVDIVGCDWYTGGNYEVNNAESYSRVMSTGKPSALTEVGPAEGGVLALRNEEGKLIGYNWTCEDLLASIKRMISDGFKVAYFLTWTGRGSIAGLTKSDKLMNDEIILTRDSLMSRWNNIGGEK